MIPPIKPKALALGGSGKSGRIRIPANSLVGGVFLASRLYSGQNPNTQKHDCSHENPLRRHMHQVRCVNQSGNHDCEPGRVNSERHKVSFLSQPRSIESRRFASRYIKATIGAPRRSHQPRSSGGSCCTGWGIEEFGPGCVLLWQLIVQNHGEQRPVHPDAAVVLDVTELSEAIHEEADA